VAYLKISYSIGYRIQEKCPVRRPPTVFLAKGQTLVFEYGGSSGMVHSAKRIKGVLRRLGFKPIAGGNSTGHETWGDCRGKRIHPVFRKNAVHHGVLFSLGLEMEAKGVLSRQRFLQVVKEAC